MESKIRYIIEQAIWDAIPTSYWNEYGGPPCAVSQLNGYVLCTVQNVIQDKIALFDAVSGVLKFELLEDLLSYRDANPVIFDVQ